MQFLIKCKAVAIAQTKKGSYKIIFVDDKANLFTCYKKTLTEEEAEMLMIEDHRLFDVNTSDTPHFLVEEEKGDKA